MINEIILIGGFTVSIGLLIIAVLTLKQSNKIQGQNIFHDLVKIEKTLWEDLEKIGGQIAIQRVLNFYEYLSFLYFEKIIDKKMTEKLFKPGLIKNYEKFRKYIRPEFGNLSKLYGEWKNEK
ncbi:MAG: hypothetical protein ABIJ05_05445 [Patescibacteria group bacterium]